LNQYVLGIDVGTTGAKAILLSASGEIKGSGYEEYSCDYPCPGWVEQDADALAHAALRVCAEAVTQAGVSPEEVVSLAVSSQRDCAIFVDASDRPMKMISWQDSRADAEMSRIEREIGADSFYELFGAPISSIWILPKILWVQKHDPVLWSRTVRIVQLQDYILKVLGADGYYADEPDAAFWCMWETDARRWSSDTIERFGIGKERLPKVTASGTAVGTVCAEAAAKIGISKRALLCVGGGDQNCASVGAGAVTPGMAAISIGTAGLVAVFSNKRFRDPKRKVMVTNSVVHGNWQIEGNQHAGASVLRWFRDEIALYDKIEAEKSGESPYDRINKMIAESPPGGRGLVFLPYFASAGSPRYNPHARGSLLGLTFMHGRKDIARAIVEGITLDLKDILVSIREAGVGVDRIRIMGGATRSDIWNQLQADCYGCTVETVKTTDAALMGAALCALVGAGIYPEVRSASEAIVKVNRVYEPDADMTAFYDESYEIYCDAYEALSSGSNVFRSIAERQKQIEE
jgi:xylulokinase